MKNLRAKRYLIRYSQDVPGVSGVFEVQALYLNFPAGLTSVSGMLMGRWRGCSRPVPPVTCRQMGIIKPGTLFDLFSGQDCISPALNTPDNPVEP
jgi:hypothetical protein